MTQDAPRPFAPFTVALALVVVGSVAAYAGLLPAFVGELGFDKVLHATMGFTLTLLLARAMGRRPWLAALLVFVPVAAEEYLQRFSSVRTSDWNDLLADAVGIAGAVTVAIVTTRRDLNGRSAPPAAAASGRQSARERAARASRATP